MAELERTRRSRTGTSDTGTADTGTADPATPDPGTRDPATSAGAPDALSYEQARDELGDLVRQLESGGTGLEESLRLWERGEHLVAVCQQWLDGARVRLEQAGTDRA